MESLSSMWKLMQGIVVNVVRVILRAVPRQDHEEVA